MIRYKWVLDRKAEGFPYTVACKVAEVSRQSFNDWRQKRAAGPTGAELADAVLVAEVREVQAEFDDTYGLVAKHGISHETVSQVWKAFGLKPWKQDSFKISPDPLLIDKVRDLVGLYMSPPVAAAVFCVDDKPQIQALNRTAPTLPTTPERATHDYQRNGTIDLFAALDIATGTVITDLRKTHTSKDFVAFLNKINRAVPAELDVHLVLDNLSAHKTPLVHRWLLRHRRFHMHFTPTYGSWMNLVERWFSALTIKQLQRGAHNNVAELIADIQSWVDIWNDNPKPFIWHKTADEILDKLASYCTTITQDTNRTESA